LEIPKLMDYVVLPACIVLCALLILGFTMRRLFSLSSKNYTNSRKLIERIVLTLIVLVTVVLGTTSAYNAIALYSFRKNNPPPGKIYLVDGHRMHIDCEGTGSPTLVLDAGLGSDSLVWGGVMPALSRTTRVCAYDRAGYGRSEAASSLRDADNIADDLHNLLLAAKIDGPIVLMGHSIAGIYLRDFVSRYPAQVAGLILIDSSTPLQNRAPAWKKLREEQPPSGWKAWIKQLVYSAGIPRLQGQCSRSLRGMDAHAAKLVTEDACHTNVATVAAELASFDRSGEETVHTGPYGDLPILIFSHDPSKTPTDDVETAWTQMQANLKNLSTHSKQIIAKGSSHFVQSDRRDLIEKEVPRFIDQIRGNTPPDPAYGITVTE
jgi:pimeloyl-ACP methyl ester carboxylesterase